MVKEDNCNLNKMNVNDTLPLVSILLAVYKPNKEWLIEQLISLNNQNYDNIEVLIYDDCPEYPVDEELFKRYITNFSYNLIRCDENKGSNKAFEELTKLGKGEFFAYCDQDDIWGNNKISTLINLIKNEDSILAYSDMKVIDKDGNVKFNTLIQAKPRLNYIYGENLLPQFFFKNCVSGCCMLIDSKVAKKAIPFSNYMIHDQWLCTIASYYGRISFTNKTLVNYRMHGNNQTGSLKGINNKEDYYKLRVDTLQIKLNELKDYIDEENINLEDIKKFCNGRINKDIFEIIKYRYLCKKEAYFEVIIKYMPNWLFKIMLNKLKS
ncbi:glycosyltransferase [uncultured Clostridium sp.]|uniref:glycosyltransferase n=1 Tax=uncultured Clostridium sp. TaxID=59620 RepID=UPI0028E7E902|nr:glycosyltransferase [uncultured Clostridium sp.]